MIISIDGKFYEIIEYRHFEVTMRNEQKDYMEVLFNRWLYDESGKEPTFKKEAKTYYDFVFDRWILDFTYKTWKELRQGYDVKFGEKEIIQYRRRAND